MKRKSLIGICLIVISAFSISAQTAVFTYQGRLNDGAATANGTYQMQFSLYDALSGGTQQGTTITNNSVTVTNGVFTVQLDFSPATPFATGADRWIEIAVRKAADPPGFTTLAPRQQITSSPFATRSSISANSDIATTAGNVTGVVAVANGGTGSSTQNFVDLSTNQYVGGAKTFLIPISGDGSQLTNINGANITNNTITASALASDTFPNNQNLSRLGQLRWDLLGQRVSVGSFPTGVAFDGTNIWVANQFSNNVTKLRASDGTLLATYSVGSSPYGIAFDGTNMWVTNFSDNTVTKLRASDGVTQGTFSVGTNPEGIAFDGVNIWVANHGSNSVTKLRASDGANLGLASVGNGPRSVAFDGANVWITLGSAGSVIKLKVSDGSPQGTFTVGTSPFGVAFDGVNIWVANFSSGSVTKLRASDGSLVGGVTVGTSPIGVAFDGTNIWVANSGSNNLTKIRASDATVLGTFVVGTGPFGVAFDGASMWVTNQTSNNLVKLPVFP